MNLLCVSYQIAPSYRQYGTHFPLEALSQESGGSTLLPPDGNRRLKKMQWAHDGHLSENGHKQSLARAKQGVNIFRKKCIQGINDSLEVLMDCTSPVYSSAHKNTLGINIHISTYRQIGFNSTNQDIQSRSFPHWDTPQPSCKYILSPWMFVANLFSAYLFFVFYYTGQRN